jgi:hypothetical protein
MFAGTAPVPEPIASRGPNAEARLKFKQSG